MLKRKGRNYQPLKSPRVDLILVFLGSWGGRFTVEECCFLLLPAVEVLEM